MAEAAPIPERAVLEGFWSGPVIWEAPLARWTTLRVGGPAWALVEPTSSEQVRQLLRGCQAAGLPWQVIGGGSNLLVSDQGFPGLVMVLGRQLGAIREVGSAGAGRVLVEVECGCRLAKLVNWCQGRGLAGLEFAAGIPGSIGGAVMMNAGAWGGEIKDVLAGLRGLQGDELREWSREELTFTYRSWQGPAEAVLLSATFVVSTGEPEAIGQRCREYIAARRGKQPRRVASAGSFFKNPPGEYAGRLIEACGLKGLAVGGARVSEVHANFLVNTGGATATDFLVLMRLVRERIQSEFGIVLEPEVKMVGNFNEVTE